MTTVYGENSGAVRRNLAELLRQHRIQQRIGGAGMHTVPISTSVAEREEIGRLIQRYRRSVLWWCRQALACADTGRLDTPDGELRRKLARTFDAITAPAATTADLTTPHDFALVDAWRLAARGAALGEHDFAGEMDRGRLDVRQALTVVKDVAEILRGLIVLDRRYKNVPGWEHLNGAMTLQSAAEHCAFLEANDYTIDRRGWRPPARAIDGPPRPGIAGVVQAQHNLLVLLAGFPHALNFRRLLDSQRLLSHLLAMRTASTWPAASSRWTERATTYAALHREAHDLGGRIGDGGAAVAQAANAVSRLRHLSPSVGMNDRALRDLGTLSDRVDARLADIFEHGARARLYFVRAQLPRIVRDDGQLVHAVRSRFVPIESPVQTELVDLVRERLRPVPDTPSPPPGAHASRLEFTEAIAHRPPSRDPSGARGLEH